MRLLASALVIVGDGFAPPLILWPEALTNEIATTSVNGRRVAHPLHAPFPLRVPHPWRVARPSVSSLPVPEQWGARPCVFCKGGCDAADIMCFVMPSGLHRTYGAHHLHFITCSCYRRLPFLGNARSRDTFLDILEQTRQRYCFVVVGYVVMPEHIHLLLTEPEVGTPSTVMQVLKQRTAYALLPKRRRKNPRQRNLFRDQPPAERSGRRASTTSMCGRRRSASRS